MNKLVITIIILIVALSVNVQSKDISEQIKGNGNVITEIRNTANYDAVHVGGSFDIMLVSGKAGKITIEGEENIIPYIITEIDHKALKISYKKHVNIGTTKPLVITVPFKDLDEIHLAESGTITSKDSITTDDLSIKITGSGDITVMVQADEVSVSIAGSGDITITGTTNKFKIFTAGSGDVDAYELQSNDVTVKIMGSGDIRTSVHNTIRGYIIGSGDLYYKGSPDTIDVKIVGPASIIGR